MSENMPSNDNLVLTVEEARTKLLTTLSGYVDYWLDEARVQTAEEKMEGMVFSMLCVLDGGTVDMPGFLLIPNVSSQDASHHANLGNKHAPQVAVTVANAMDLAGVLHELWYKVRKASKSAPKFNGTVPLRETDGKQDLKSLVKSMPNEIDQPWNEQ